MEDAEREKECREAFLTSCIETSGLNPTIHHYRQWRIGWMARDHQLRDNKDWRAEPAYREEFEELLENGINEGATADVRESFRALKQAIQLRGYPDG